MTIQISSSLPTAARQSPEYPVSGADGQRKFTRGHDERPANVDGGRASMWVRQHVGEPAQRMAHHVQERTRTLFGRHPQHVAGPGDVQARALWERRMGDDLPLGLSVPSGSYPSRTPMSHAFNSQSNEPSSWRFTPRPPTPQVQNDPLITHF